MLISHTSSGQDLLGIARNILAELSLEDFGVNMTQRSAEGIYEPCFACSDEELMKKERDTKEELFNLRVQIATNQTTNVARVRKLKKDLARVLTLKKERELGIRRK